MATRPVVTRWYR